MRRGLLEGQKQEGAPKRSPPRPGKMRTGVVTGRYKGQRGWGCA
jgi:hypothetical protein